MKTVFYWSPCLNKVGTYKSTINSALSFPKYSKGRLLIKIINVCGEWDEKKDFLLQNNIQIINLGLNYFKYLPKLGFLKSRFSYILIFFLSFIPLLKLLRNEKPDFIVIHLITSLPLVLVNFFDIKTRCILRISGFPKLNFLRKIFWKIVQKKIYKVMCPSSELKSQIIKNRIFNEKKVVFLPDPIIRIKDVRAGINMSKKNLEFNNSRKYFISVGRLTKQKNFDYLIDEFYIFAKKNDDFDLLIFGDGEYKSRLIKKIKNYGMSDRIFLKGYSENIYAYMNKAKSLILSSLWEDPGFVIIEAAACNLFIISSNCKNGPEEFLLNGKGGLLFESNKQNELSRNLDNFLNMGKETQDMKILAKKNSKKYTLFRHYKILSSVLMSN